MSNFLPTEEYIIFQFKSNFDHCRLRSNNAQLWDLVGDLSNNPRPTFPSGSPFRPRPRPPNEPPTVDVIPPEFTPDLPNDDVFASFYPG